MKKLAPLLSLLALSTLTPALAAGEHDTHHKADASAATAEAAQSEGTVKKVDKSAGKITISHGPLASLGMPPMTMVFRAADPAMLDQVKAGDKIRFTADKVDGAFTVMTLESAN